MQRSIGIMCGLIIGLVANVAMAQKWGPPDQPVASPAATSTEDERMKKMVRKLNRAINKAEERESADPRFLRRLRRILARHGAVTAKVPEPADIWQSKIFDQTFNRSMKALPSPWSIREGRFSIESELGLRSVIHSDRSAGGNQSSGNQNQATDFLGAILNEAIGGGQRRAVTRKFGRH